MVVAYSPGHGLILNSDPPERDVVLLILLQEPGPTLKGISLRYSFSPNHKIFCYMWPRTISGVR